MSNLDWECSDHRPMELMLEPPVRPLGSGARPSGFKFNAHWVRHQECRQIILESGNWAGSEGSVRGFHQNLSRCSVRLKQWGRDANRYLFDNIK